MAEGILGLGAGQASTLNQDLIDKLKKAEKKAKVEPLENDLKKIEKEREVFSKIETKVKEVLEAIKPFDLFVKGGSTAFDQKAATTSGDSVVFDAINPTKLNEGTTRVKIDSLAQKDVFQTNSVTSAQKDSLSNIGTLSINVNGTNHNFNTADYSSYEDLSKDINSTAGIKSSVEKVGDDNYRLVIKSEKSGVSNGLSISGTAANTLGLDNSSNHIQVAKDMKAFVDGIEYNVPENKLEVDGLQITANKVGESSISIANDKTKLEGQFQNFVNKFNELIGMVDNEVGSAESPLSDKSGLRNMIFKMKDKMFGSYGQNSDKSIFNLGISLNKDGSISFDNKKFKDAVESDLAGLKDFFVGTAAKEGFGTKLKSTIDEFSFSGGILRTYDDSMNTREATLKEDKEKAEEDLKEKYKQLSIQFGAYGAIINQFESAFAGLKLMIQQSIASN